MASYKLAPDTLPRQGDHLWILRQGYSHHGLYLGENNEGEALVIHYAGWIRHLDSGPLEIADLNGFADGRTVYVREYQKRRFSREDCVLRALSRLGEEKYNVHSNNCEHLCHWAIMGDQRSAQIEWVDTVLGAIHPGLEAISRGLGTLSAPGNTSTASKRKAAGNIAKDLALDWGLKSAARWAAGPVGVAAYVGYRVSRQWLRSRQR
ncbi:MAG: lecithin retinol acyltransferase family protein [Reinekea sp.]